MIKRKAKGHWKTLSRFSRQIHFALYSLLNITDDARRRMIFRPLQGCEGMMSNRGMSKVLHISLNILFSLKSVRKKALLNTPCYVKEREKFTTVIIIECSQKLINPLWVSGVVFLFSKCTMKLVNQNIKLQFSCTEVCISHLACMGYTIHL